MNEDLYKIMKDVYTKYTGYQVAEVVGVIRKEIQEQEEKIRIQNEIDTLTQRLDDLK